MKTKLNKNFNEFLDEASKPKWLRNDLGKMRKRGRIPILVDKIKNGEEILTVNGLQVLDKKIEVNGVEHDVKSMTQTLEDPASTNTKVKFFVKGKPLNIKDTFKTPEFGGKGAGSGEAAEDAYLKSFQNNLQQTIEKEGAPYITIIIKGRKEKVTDVIKTPPYRGDRNPKSDFSLIGLDGQTQVGFISHKAGSGPRDFQQYGGISKDKQLADNPKVQDFAKAVKDARPGGLVSGDKFTRTVKDPKVKQLALYGPEAGKKPSPYNVDEFHQGQMSLKGGNGVYKIVSNHKVVRPKVPKGGYEPTYVARYNNRTQTVGKIKIDKARLGVFAKDQYKNSKEI